MRNFTASPFSLIEVWRTVIYTFPAEKRRTVHALRQQERIISQDFPSEQSLSISEICHVLADNLPQLTKSGPFFRIRFPTIGHNFSKQIGKNLKSFVSFSPGYGTLPKVKSSQRRTPYDQTSDSEEKMRSVNDSIAIHLTGINPCTLKQIFTSMYCHSKIGQFNNPIVG